MANTFNDPFSAAVAASFNNDPFGVPRAPRPVEEPQVPYASPGAAAPAADLSIPVPTPEATASYQIASPPRQPITLSEFLINPNILSKFNGSKATAFDFYFANYLPAEIKNGKVEVVILKF